MPIETGCAGCGALIRPTTEMVLAGADVWRFCVACRPAAAPPPRCARCGNVPRRGRLLCDACDDADPPPDGEPLPRPRLATKRTVPHAQRRAA